MRGIGLLALSFTLFASISGCSTVKVPIAVTHPAEINMSQYKQIAIGKFNGNLGKELAAGIKNRLVEGGQFKVIDRRRMKQIMSELNLAQSDLSESKNRLKLGKLLNASALISGQATGKYTEDTTSSKGKCDSKSCTHYTRKGRYQTSGSIDVIDIETGEIIRSKLLDSQAKDSNRATDKSPDPINQDKLKQSALSKSIRHFLKAINPWTEMVDVPFIKDSNIPELEKGINITKLGELDRSIKVFANAAKAAEGNADIGIESIAKAYFNLGLAYSFSWQFNHAETALKKAFELDPDDDYLKWIKKNKQLEQERTKLIDQGVANES